MFLRAESIIVFFLAFIIHPQSLLRALYCINVRQKHGNKCVARNIFLLITRQQTERSSDMPQMFASFEAALEA